MNEGNLTERICELRSRLARNVQAMEDATRRAVEGDEKAVLVLGSLSLEPKVLPGMIGELERQRRDLVLPQLRKRYLDLVEQREKLIYEWKPVSEREMKAALRDNNERNRSHYKPDPHYTETLKECQRQYADLARRDRELLNAIGVVAMEAMRDYDVDIYKDCLREVNAIVLRLMQEHDDGVRPERPAPPPEPIFRTQP